MTDKIAWRHRLRHHRRRQSDLVSITIAVRRRIVQNSHVHCKENLLNGRPTFYFYARKSDEGGSDAATVDGDKIDDVAAVHIQAGDTTTMTSAHTHTIVKDEKGKLSSPSTYLRSGFYGRHGFICTVVFNHIGNYWTPLPVNHTREPVLKLWHFPLWHCCRSVSKVCPARTLQQTHFVRRC